MMIARLLGATGFGVFAITLSAAGLIASFGLLGFDNYAVREVSRLRTREEFGLLKGFVTASTVVVLLASSLGGVVVYSIFSLVSPDASIKPAWILMVTPLMALLLLARGVAQGFGRVLDTQAPSELLRPGLMVLSLGAVWVIVMPVTPNQILGLFTIANLAALVFASWLIYRLIVSSTAGVTVRFSVAEWFNGAWPFFGLGLLIVLQSEINTLMLGWLAGPSETGLFQPLLRLTPVMVIAIQAINVPLAPRISELWEQGETSKLRHTVRLATLTSTAAVVATCIVLLLAAPWILAAFGAEFVVNVSALWWLAAAQVFNAACGSVGILLNMTGYQGQAFRGLLVAVAVNFALGLWLIPAHGAHGAAIAFAGSTIVWNIVLLRAVRKRLGFDPSLVAAVVNISRKDQ